MDDCCPAIEARELVVEYGRGGGRTRAVDRLSFVVRQGECVGFIGANGAGKSTTIKTLMGFMFPASGEVRVFDRPAGSIESRRRIGYLPEVALYYPFMKAGELLALYGGLSGMTRAQLRERIPDILGKVGLPGQEKTLLRNFSKGMQQRLGIAQSLIADPDLLIFDELSSGLDPLGRHDLRQALLELKDRGRTIFFSSHELSEVETLCDRALIIHKGRLVAESAVADLMKPLNEFEIVFQPPEAEAAPPELAGMPVSPGDGQCHMIARNADDFARAVAELSRRRWPVIRTATRVRSLEEYFIDLVRGAGDGS